MGRANLAQRGPVLLHSFDFEISSFKRNMERRRTHTSHGADLQQSDNENFKCNEWDQESTQGSKQAQCGCKARDSFCEVIPMSPCM